VANPNNPTGFLPFGQMAAPGTNFALQERQILSTYNTKIHRGTPVVLNGGYLNAAAAGAVQVAGIFWDCEFYNQSINRWIWSPWWPGNAPSPAGMQIRARIYDDPNMVFRVQTDGTAPVAFASSDNNIQFVAGVGNDVTGFSGFSANHTPAPTATFPFRMVGLLSQWATPGTDGTDDTSPFNVILVRLNNTDRLSLTGLA
jgi:hypothetical protein